MILVLALPARIVAVFQVEQDVAQARAIVTTHHQVTIGGRVLRYTARAGTIPIRDDESGDVHANMFFVAYTIDRAPGGPARPLTFLWNGGPGSNSGLVHLLGFGPRRITTGTGSSRVVDNQETWLTASDLVFVDPIGTGYSRPTRPEYAPEFYQSRGDAESVAEFIRVSRLRLAAYDSPIYLVGESYGVTRASLVADALTRRGTKVAGVILLSGEFPLASDVPAALDSALRLPVWAAAAYYHKKLAPDLQHRPIDDVLGASLAYATGDYARALARGDSLAPAERGAVVAQVARFTGLPASQIDTTTLRVTTEQMSTTLLGRDRMVGRYDSRLSGPPDTSGGPYDPTTDPSLKDILDGAAVLRYLREELGYRSDLFYQGPFGGGYPPPTRFRGDWMSVRWNWKADSATTRGAALGAALARDPGLRVFIGCGYFDLLGWCYAEDYAARHLSPALGPRVVSRIYAGAHAIYTDDAARRALSADALQFIAAGQPARSAAGTARPQDVATFREPALATTRHEIRINGAALRYTARIGLLAIRNNESGDVHGHFGFVWYAREAAPGEPPRPVIFLWNGGPGANSTTVQFTGFGPRRLRTPDDPAHPSPVTPGLYDNDATWLTFADLVFVDPPGTGFARPSKPEYATEFYSTLGDIASTAEFIRAFRVRWSVGRSGGRAVAPIYLAGESYGAWRAAGVAEALEQRGVRVAGVILISGGLGMGQVAPDAIRTALFVPARTAAAFYHRTLGPELLHDEQSTLREAQEWALSVYAPAWQRRDSLDAADRASIAAGLARYTGVAPSSIDQTTLRMTSPQFTATLLKDRGQKLDRYDMRVVHDTGAAGRDAGSSNDKAILRYLHDDLGFKTDLAYQGIETGWSATPDTGDGHGPGAQWDWNQGDTSRAAVGSGDGPPGGSQPWMRRAMTRDPGLRLFVAAGEYDSLNSCADNAWSVAHLEPRVARNVSLGCYGAGHMMYDTRGPRLRLRDDIARFVTK